MHLMGREQKEFDNKASNNSMEISPSSTAFSTETGTRVIAKNQLTAKIVDEENEQWARGSIVVQVNEIFSDSAKSALGCVSGLKLTTSDFCGRTPLFFAVKGEIESTVQQLLALEQTKSNLGNEEQELLNDVGRRGDSNGLPFGLDRYQAHAFGTNRSENSVDAEKEFTSRENTGVQVRLGKKQN